jgi:hypothetical protein
MLLNDRVYRKHRIDNEAVNAVKKSLAVKRS